MDFSKVQKIRESQRKKRVLLMTGIALFSIAMVVSVIPWLRVQVTKHASKASAGQILDLIEKEQFHDAYEKCLKPALKQQHPFKDFETTWKNLLLKKGPIWDKSLRGYISRPNGKPYELVTYRLQHERGSAMIDFAMEPQESGGFLVRAYRIEASGL